MSLRNKILAKQASEQHRNCEQELVEESLSDGQTLIWSQIFRVRSGY